MPVVARIVNGKYVAAGSTARDRDRLRDMLESGRPPRGISDCTFLRGHANGSQFESQPEIGDIYAAAARAGGQVTKGKVYLSSLAEYPGDPRAWVESRDDVRKLCEERNYSCEGTVNVRMRNDLPPAESPPVADDLVDAAVARAVAADPGLREKDAGEVRHAVKEAITPHWKKRKTTKKKGS